MISLYRLGLVYSERTLVSWDPACCSQHQPWKESFSKILDWLGHSGMSCRYGHPASQNVPPHNESWCGQSVDYHRERAAANKLRTNTWSATSRSTLSRPQQQQDGTVGPGLFLFSPPDHDDILGLCYVAALTGCQSDSPHASHSWFVVMSRWLTLKKDWTSSSGENPTSVVTQMRSASLWLCSAVLYFPLWEHFIIQTGLWAAWCELFLMINSGFCLRCLWSANSLQNLKLYTENSWDSGDLLLRVPKSIFILLGKL